MRLPLNSKSIIFTIATALFFCSFALQQVQAQKLRKYITDQDLASIRAAVQRDPSLLNQQDSRTKRAPLYDAIRSGHLDVVNLLLELGASVDTVDSRKQTPLHFALTRRRPEIIKSILSKTENVNQQDGRQKATYLMYAIMFQNGNLDLIKTMLQKGADVNLKNSSDQTALHIACYRNQLEAAKAMIAAGAELGLQDNKANTPLLAACFVSPELTSELLSRGADPLVKDNQSRTSLHLICQAGANSVWDSEVGLKAFKEILSKFEKVDLLDQLKVTPLCAAVGSQNSKFVKLLIERGADPNVVFVGGGFGRSGSTPLISIAASYGDAASVRALVDGGASVNVVGSDGQTPLHLVARRGSFFGNPDAKTTERFTKTVEILLNAKADPNAKNKAGQTPLAIAASREFSPGVELLVEQTDKLGGLVLPGGSILHWAAEKGLLKTCQRLLSKGAVSVNNVNSKGQVPLQLAARTGNAGVVELLIANEAKLDHADNEGETALLVAASGGHAEVVEKLLAAGADTKKRDSSGHSALHLAAWAGNTTVISELLKHMKVVESTTSSGYTPLHAAAWVGHAAAVKTLLQGGADPNSADSDGWTPLHKAAYRGHAAVVRALIENGADKSINNGVEMTALQLAQSNGKAKEIEPILK